MNVNLIFSLPVGAAIQGVLPVELTYALTKRDLTALDFYLYRRNFFRPNQGLPWAIIHLLMLLLMGNNLYHVSRGEPFGLWVWKPLGFLLLFLLVSVLELVLRRRSLSKTNPRLFVEQTYTIGPEGIRLGDGENVSVIRWLTIQNIESRGKHLFIVLAANYVIIIPHRVFGSPQAASAYLAQLEQMRKKYISAGIVSSEAAPAEDSQSLHITFIPQPEDMTAASRLITKKDSVNPWVLTGIFSTIGLLTLGGLTFFFYDTWGNSPKTFRTLMTVFVTILLGFGTATGLVFWIRARRQIRRRRALLQKKSTSITQKITVQLKAEGVSFCDVSGAHFVTWNSIRSVSEDAERLYIRTNPGWVCPVPRRAFGTPLEAQAFFRFAISRWRLARTPEGTDNPW